MSDNRRQILEMLSAGKVSPDEAERLLAVVDRDRPNAGPANGAMTSTANSPKYLRVIADVNDDTEGPIKVNVRIPLQLLRAGVKLSSLIPSSAQPAINAALQREGVEMDVTQLRPQDLEELVDQLKDLTVDVDSKNENLKVRVFCE